jgi:hypothetical protein
MKILNRLACKVKLDTGLKAAGFVRPEMYDYTGK